MPVYEYGCTKCGFEKEVFQKMSDTSIEVCSKCGCKMKKLISNSSFHLKGAGWYVTDYKSSKKQLDKSSGQVKKEKPADVSKSK